MTIVIQNNAEGDVAAYFVGKSTPEGLIMHLYQNNVTPAETDTAAAYTEATFTGYAAATLTGASWTVTEGAPTSAGYAQQTFTLSATETQDVYGYYYTRATSGRIAGAERFTGAPFTLQNVNDAIKITPTITFD